MKKQKRKEREGTAREASTIRINKSGRTWFETENCRLLLSRVTLRNMRDLSVEQLSRRNESLPKWKTNLTDVIGPV